MAGVNVTIGEIGNETTQNVTGKIPATPEGMAVAYGSLFIMAIIPIFYGSLRSVNFHSEQKSSGNQTESMSSKDAAMFPIMASITLFGLFLFFKFFSKEYINLLLTFYFFFLGVLALTHIMTPFFKKLIPSCLPNQSYHLILTKGEDQNKEEMCNYKFDNKELVCLCVCSLVGVWYLIKRHWIANNIFGLAFAFNGIEFLQLNRVTTGCILLGGLFVYDIFWVFGTNVMITVAKSFEAPIKLVFPQDLLEKGLDANNFAMLGLGDIVIPGIFIALLLRFDVSVHPRKRTYFYSCFFAYILGLGITIFVMHVFKHAQPALLYLVPSCIGIPLLVALVKGELQAMFNYADNPDVKPLKEDSGNQENEKKVEPVGGQIDNKKAN